jgi:hypothetical protein
LALLTMGAFLALVVGVLGSGRSALLLVPGAAFLVLATGGFAWVTRTRRPVVRYVYVAVLLGLGLVAFDVAGPSVGTTLLLVVLASQSVLLLPVPAAVVVVVLIPLVHVACPSPRGSGRASAC